MNKEEAIKQLKKHKQEIDKQYISSRYSKAIEVALNLIREQEKIINDIKFIAYNNKPHITQEKIIEYFKKVVDEDG